MSIAPRMRSQVDWRVATGLLPEVAQWADDKGYLFATDSWARLFPKIGAASYLSAWHCEHAVGVIIPVFRRFGVRIGILGFPLSGEALETLTDAELGACARSVLAAGRLHLLRVNCSRSLSGGPMASGVKPDVWIDNLPEYRVEGRKKLRKDLAHARRSTCGIEVLDQMGNTDSCYELYADTVQRHHGNLRYTPSYFRALAELASKSRLVHIVTAMEHGAVRGFSVLACHGGVGYYLHSAVDPGGRRQGISDLLMDRLVELARQQGCRSLNLMASPWDQQGLLRFKQKWGSRNGAAWSTDFSRGLIGKGIGLMTSWNGRIDRRKCEIHEPTF